MTIYDIVDKYGVSESTARRKMKSFEGKKKKTPDGKTFVDYKIGDVKVAFRPTKFKPGPKAKA